MSQIRTLQKIREDILITMKEMNNSYNQTLACVDKLINQVQKTGGYFSLEASHPVNLAGEYVVPSATLNHPDSLNNISDDRIVEENSISEKDLSDFIFDEED